MQHLAAHQFEHALRAVSREAVSAAAASSSDAAGSGGALTLSHAHVHTAVRAAAARLAALSEVLQLLAHLPLKAELVRLFMTRLEPAAAAGAGAEGHLAAAAPITTRTA